MKLLMSKRIIKIFGRLLALVGWGIIAHDFAHQVWELKGTVFSVEGGYVGLIICLIGILIIIWSE